ncbi:UMP kinase [Peptoniphilus sp. GNH]|nr:UMP kinase [Clostridiales bacterium KA00134]UHR02910.1 UMP kinase [Peptoniphilus sp. GNH]
MNPKYTRVILKLSGEALAGNEKVGIDLDTIKIIASEVKAIRDLGVEVGVVVGGGNFWRGRDASDMDRATSDYMGMLGTVMNSLAIQDALESMGVATRVMTAIEMKDIAEPYIRRRAIRHLEKGRVVIFSAGIGAPYFSTDTTAALRAAETNAEVILVAKKGVDGIYDADPKIVRNAKKYDELTYHKILSDELKIMDSTAISLCMENKIPLLVFGIDTPSTIVEVVKGKNLGTVVK